MDFDYSQVLSPARIAVYDDLLSAPRIIEIPGAPTHEFINNLASEVYNLSNNAGGGIPYTAIKQVAENSIHANFQEIVVSILDGGNTIRFSDQGPGISDKQAALRPGFSSATEQMKRYIDGVGSGLPIVHEYLDVKNGSLLIEDNINGGSVITLSLNAQITDIPNVDKTPESYIPNTEATIPNCIPNRSFLGIDIQKRTLETEYLQQQHPHTEHEFYTKEAGAPSNSVQQGYHSISQPAQIHSIQSDNRATAQVNFITQTLSPRRRAILSLLLQDTVMGVQEVSNMTGIPLSSTHSELRKLEESGLIEKLGKKRILTPLGKDVAAAIATAV